MLFKHLNIYRLGERVDVDQLEGHLESMPFAPCLPNQEKSAGFTTVFGMDNRVFSANGCLLFCLVVQEKVMPSAAVKAEFQKALMQREAKGDRLNREEKKALKEEVRLAMLPRAFIRNAELWAYVDNQNKTLVINTTSQKSADGVAQALRGIVKDSQCHPISPQHSVGQRMTFWVSEDQAPDPFEMGFKCMISDGEGSIRYSKRSLEDDNLRDYLRDGLHVCELALVYKDRCELALTDDFMIKDFSLTDVAHQDYDPGAGEPLELLAADLTLMSNEVRDLLSDLLNVLGGETAHQEGV